VKQLNHLPLVREVSYRTMLPEDTVRLVLETVFDVAKEYLAANYRVIFKNFGTLRTQIRSHVKFGTFPVIIFRASNDLQETVRKELIRG
jgi:nucleoid DNA-binding protein